METLLQDLKYAARFLLRTPGFALVAIITLALGIGANTAVFSVVNAVLLRPLPYPQPDRLVMVWENNPKIQVGFDNLPVSAGAFAAWREQGRSFAAVAAFEAVSFALSGAGTPDRLRGVGVTADFFQVMGVSPAMGRAFTPDEDQPGSNRVIVVSHALWQQRFGGDPDLVGRALKLDGMDYTVIGIMPAGFEFPRAGELPMYMDMPPRTQFWTPAGLTREELTNFGSHYFATVARLQPGAALEQAQTEVRAVSRRLEEVNESSKGWSATLVPLQTQIVGDARTALLVIFAAVGFVLLIACANVANLLLARSVARQREMSIRVALGAGRWRVVRQLLTESLALAVVGGALGLLLALWGVDLLKALGPGHLPRLAEVSLDGRVFGFTLAASLLTGFVFGLAPALQVSRPNLTEALKEGGRGASESWRRNRTRSLMVIGEVALSLILLVGAGLLLRSFARLTQAHPGFNPEGVMTMRIELSNQRFGGSEPQAAFFKQVLERAAVVPGVQAGGAVSHLPLSGQEEIDDFTVEGVPPARGAESPLADMRSISPDYFRAMGIRLTQGRAFTEQDNQNAPGVAIVSESLARRFWPGADPLGKRINRGDPDDESDWLTVVGVVEDVKHSTLEAESRPHLYMSYLQTPWAYMTLVARTSVDPASVAGAIREAVWAVDKDQPVTEVRPMRDYLATAVATRRFNLQLLALFALIALALTAIGLYGVMSYLVTQRRHEIGIRMALGALPREVLGLVVRQGMALVLVGMAAGLAGTLVLTRVMAGLLFEVSATDPLSIAGVSLLLAGVALLATYIPARRAARIDPMAALRHE